MATYRGAESAAVQGRCGRNGLVVAGLAGCGGDKATLDTFEGGWIGHGRTLSITPTGKGREWATLGLGHFVMDVRFKLSQPKGTPDDATATATVTSVRLGKEKVFTAKHPAPRVGESRTIRLRDDDQRLGRRGLRHVAESSSPVQHSQLRRL